MSASERLMKKSKSRLRATMEAMASSMMDTIVKPAHWGGDGRAGG
jgi:hypothetical protein